MPFILTLSVKTFPLNSIKPLAPQITQGPPYTIPSYFPNPGAEMFCLADLNQNTGVPWKQWKTTELDADQIRAQLGMGKTSFASQFSGRSCCFVVAWF